MFEFNYSVGDIRNSDLGEGIICSGEGIGGKGGGKWGKGGRKWGKRGREVGVRGEGSWECLPPCPPPQIEKSFKFDLYHTKGKFNRQQFDDIFFRKQGLIFHANSVFWNKSEKYFKMLYVDFFFFFFFSSVQLASVIFYVIYYLFSL